MSTDTLVHVRYVGNSQPGDRTTKIIGSQGSIKLGEDGYLTEEELARVGRYQFERLDSDSVVDLTAGVHEPPVDAPPTVPAPPTTFGSITTPGTGN